MPTNIQKKAAKMKKAEATAEAKYQSVAEKAYMEVADANAAAVKAKVAATAAKNANQPSRQPTQLRSNGCVAERAQKLHPW